MCCAGGLSPPQKKGGVRTSLGCAYGKILKFFFLKIRSEFSKNNYNKIMQDVIILILYLMKR